MISLQIAIRFLWRNLGKTIVTLIAIAFGFAIFYFILDVSSGLRDTVLHTTAESDAHIRVTTELPFTDFNSESSKELREDIFNLSSLISDVSFSYRTLITTNFDADSSVFELRGVDFELGKKISDIVYRIEYSDKNKIPENAPENADYDAEIAVGNIFMENRPMIQMGDIITFKNQYDELFRLKIVAVFLSDQSILSSSTFFTTLKDAQKIGSEDIVNYIEIRVKNPVDSYKVTPIIKEFAETHFTNPNVYDWQNGNKSIINLIYIEDISVIVIQLMTGFAISFGVGSVLMFQAKAKINQIGILKALGLKDKDTMLIFFYQALIISVIGSIIGLHIGYTLDNYFTSNYHRTSGLPLVPLQTELINVYSILTLAIMIPTNLIASLIPLRFVKNLKIIEVIKHE